MNNFGFDVSEAIVGLLTFFTYGLFFGTVFFGIIRALLFSIVERKEA